MSGISLIPITQSFTAAGLALVQASDASNQRLLLGLDTIQYSIPTVGQTIVSDGSIMLALNPATSLASLTVTLPQSPANKQLFNIATSQAVTVLTLSGGTIVGTLTSLALGGFASFRWLSTPAIWFRIG